MPNRDGTGPLGTGAAVGRGLGYCSRILPRRFESGSGTFLCRGLGSGLRCGRGGLYDPFEVDEKELLNTQKNILERRLNSVNKQLDKFQGDE